MFKFSIYGFLFALVLSFVVCMNKGCTRTEETLRSEIRQKLDATEMRTESDKAAIDRKFATDVESKKSDFAKRQKSEESRFETDKLGLERAFQSKKAQLEKEIAVMEADRGFITTLRGRIGSDGVNEFLSVGSDIKNVESILRDAEAVYVALDRTKWMASDWWRLANLEKKTTKSYGEVEQLFRKAAGLIKLENALQNAN